MEISEEMGSNECLSENDIKFLLLFLAFFTPYLLCFIPGPGYTNIVLYAPLWAFGTRNYPIFRFTSLEAMIVELPFGLIRLAFIQQVLLYKKNLTDSGKLVLVGIFCELPGPILYFVLGVSGLGSPFPLFFIVGLLLARFTTKEPLSWIEKGSSTN
jgi:hypothetical protein